mgnify:FL=1
MTGTTSFRRFLWLCVIWFGAAVAGLTVALVAVGWLGLWVAVGAVAGLGTGVVGGALGQFLLATDYDEILARRDAARTGSGKRGDLS